MEPRLIELIAAGEVVERPASVVKELVENSIDAGSHHITVEIAGGGISLIRVSDDGCGILPDDVPTAFIRHATSKLRDESELDSILTLGFRGEALPSIAAVSQIELITRTKEQNIGLRYTSDEKGVNIEEAGCPVGTTISVRELFYNIPARMKFLKSVTGEGNAVAAVCEHLAISVPSVSFRFIRDGKEQFLTPGDGETLSSIYAVNGRAFASQLLVCTGGEGAVSVSGFITRPEHVKASRAAQRFYLNGRFVRSKTCMAALEQAFKATPGRFPGCVLFLTLPPDILDVNVHPAKLEVRFENEKLIFDAVFYAVKNALLSVGAVPELIPLPDEPVTPPVRMSAEEYKRLVSPPPEPQQMNIAPAAPRTPVMPTVTSPPVNIPAVNAPAAAAVRTMTAEAAAPVITEPARAQDTVSFADMHVIGEAFGVYIVAESGDDLYFIDKHAAHERVIYERLKRTQARDSQLLLEPVTVTLPSSDYHALIEHKSVFEDMGFEIEDIGFGSVRVQSAPLVLSGMELSGIIEDMAAKLSASRAATPERLETLLHSASCRAAVMAGEESRPLELEDILLLLHLEDVRECPHGRPIVIVMRKYELDRKFKR